MTRVGRRSAAQSMPLRLEPRSGKAVAAVVGNELRDGGLVGLGRGGREGQRGIAEAELEQTVAASRLAVIVALRRRPRDDLNLAIVEPEAGDRPP